MLDNATFVMDLLDLVILRVPVCGILVVTGVKCVLANSSGDKSENFVTP